MSVGLRHATRTGFSLAIDGILIPEQKARIMDDAHRGVKEAYDRYITNSERYNKVVDIRGRACDQISKALKEDIGPEETAGRAGVKQSLLHCLFRMEGSGANFARLGLLAGMCRPAAGPGGSIIDMPITANLREGLDALQCFIHSSGARHAGVMNLERAGSAGLVVHRLLEAAQDLIVTERDCSTTQGLRIAPNIEAGEAIEGIATRVWGRGLAEGIFLPGRADEVLIPRNTLLDGTGGAQARG